MPMHFINQICTADGKRETIDSLITGSNKDIWAKSLSNDWGRLAQGNSLGIKGTDTIECIHQHQVRKDSSATHASHTIKVRVAQS